MYLTDLADAVRKSGLRVVEVKGWETRGRPGTFDPIGVLCHHTAGEGDGYDDAHYMAAIGRSDLKAPLAHLALSRDGTVYVLAAGRANHAGRCKPIAGLRTYPGRDYGDGNAQLIGIEAQNTGSEGWTDEQYAAYVRLCAALNAHYGFPVKRTLAHRETSTSGKPDPGRIDMPTFRRDVAALNLNDPSEEDPLPSVSEVWTTDLTKKGRIGGNDVNESPLDIVTRTARNVEYIAGLVKALDSASDVAAEVAKVLPAGSAVDQATLTRAFLDALASLASQAVAAPAEEPSP